MYGETGLVLVSYSSGFARNHSELEVNSMNQTLLFAELAPDPMLSFPEPLSERYRPQRPEQPKPNFARIIKEQTGNVRAALMQLGMRLA